MSIFKAPAGLKPPVCDRRPQRSEWHSQVIEDEYAWLRCEDWLQVVREPAQLEQDIVDYLADENAYCDTAMQDSGPLQQLLLSEMRGRIRQDESDIPENDGPWAYYWRYRPTQEHPSCARVPRDSWREAWLQGEPEPGFEYSGEQVLVDGELESANSDYFEFGDCEVSPDHRYFAWSCDTTGSEFGVLKIREIASGCDLDYVIEDVESVSWATPAILLYTRLDDNHRASRVYRHSLGTDPSNDVLVMQEEDTRFSMSVGLLKIGSLLEISIGTDDQDEIWLLDTAHPESPPTLVAARRDGHEYSVDVQGDSLVILTNSGGATDFRIMTAPLHSPREENWQELISHEPGRLILELDAYQDYLVWMERRAALPQIVVRHNDGTVLDIGFPEEAYALGCNGSPEYDCKTLRFSYSSPTTPEEYYDLDVVSGDRTLLMKSAVPGGHEPANYITRRLFAPSTDGELVPLTCLFHKDTPLDGTAPCLLYGYGAYGSSIAAGFSTTRLSLVDRGFVYVVAHVRGGEERGRDWYLSTKGAGKQRSFDDFIAVAEFLLQEKLCAPGRLVCMGGSAGGLLVGAVINQAPHLFAGAIAAVPFVDVLNTMLDADLPLTPGEWAQWGNPVVDDAAFDWIRSYSPYDQVKGQVYPALLATASVSDPRVGYWEPAKWVARLRSNSTGDNVILLHTHMQAGHFGISGRFGGLEDSALTYAFAIQAAGLELR